jgi:hypothetical protein
MIDLHARFDLLSTVTIDGDIKAVVTMVRFHPGRTVDYFVAWWNNGDMREQWIDEERLS